jgi:asparagine N-glycosylation enzyme membrane subunit Stt3
MKFELKKYWYVFVLLLILLFSYYIRSLNIVPDRLLSFDPIFQYRFTKYLADWGHLPVWDELTYYVGRQVDFSYTQPLMYYITALAYWILAPLWGLSLMTVSSYMSAVYGALIVIPAFLLGRELSNKYGGLMAAALMGTAPQILTRTFGSSYDTDQVVMFFLILTLYSGFILLRKRTIPNFCLAVISFSGFMIAWIMFPYTYIILVAFVVMHFLINIFFEIRERKKFSEKVKSSFSKIKPQIIALIALLVGIFTVGFFNDTNVLINFSALLGFAQNAEKWIVNISIAELQPFSIFNLEGWITAMGRFISGDTIIDLLIFSLFIVFLAFGILINVKRKEAIISSFLITLFLIAIYTTFRGIRFTEYTTSFFIILVSAGFGSLVEFGKKDVLYKSIFLGMGILVILFALSIGFQLGKSLGPDVNSNWDSAWTFLNTKTPELSIVGTWWDPGHMITGLAERRAFADGAHCEGGNDGKNACLYTINDRIADLGKIMVTSDENESLSLIRKYQGDSPKVYWIASDDLIGKFQWLQYFGTGCDARTDQSCPLYMQIPINQQGNMVDSNGNLVLRSYPLGTQTQILIYNSQVPIPIYIQGINAVLFDEFIAYNGTQPITIRFNETEKNTLITSLKPLESQLNIRFSNQSIPMTVWIPNFIDYIVVIPPTLRNSVFTKMFMLSGQGLDHFKEVFSNPQVKIFEVLQ